MSAGSAFAFSIFKFGLADYGYLESSVAWRHGANVQAIIEQESELVPSSQELG
jgi:hypothetical protein